MPKTREEALEEIYVEKPFLKEGNFKILSASNELELSQEFLTYIESQINDRVLKTEKELSDKYQELIAPYSFDKLDSKEGLTKEDDEILEKRAWLVFQKITILFKQVKEKVKADLYREDSADSSDCDFRVVVAEDILKRDWQEEWEQQEEARKQRESEFARLTNPHPKKEYSEKFVSDLRAFIDKALSENDLDFLLQFACCFCKVPLSIETEYSAKVQILIRSEEDRLGAPIEDEYFLFVMLREAISKMAEKQDLEAFRYKTYFESNVKTLFSKEKLNLEEVRKSIGAASNNFLFLRSLYSPVGVSVSLSCKNSDNQYSLAFKNDLSFQFLFEQKKIYRTFGSKRSTFFFLTKEEWDKIFLLELTFENISKERRFDPIDNCRCEKFSVIEFGDNTASAMLDNGYVPTDAIVVNPESAVMEPPPNIVSDLQNLLPHLIELGLVDKMRIISRETPYFRDSYPLEPDYLQGAKNLAVFNPASLMREIYIATRHVIRVMIDMSIILGVDKDGNFSDHIDTNNRNVALYYSAKSDEWIYADPTGKECSPQISQIICKSLDISQDKLKSFKPRLLGEKSGRNFNLMTIAACLMMSEHPDFYLRGDINLNKESSDAVITLLQRLQTNPMSIDSIKEAITKKILQSTTKSNPSPHPSTLSGAAASQPVVIGKKKSVFCSIQ